MSKLISNDGGKDSVRAAFDKLATPSRSLSLAAPYFTYADPLLDALRRGCAVRLLVGLNAATHPHALRQILNEPRSSIRFYTGGFHAKLYVFDASAMVGSANLTQAGFQSNREVVACFNELDDPEAIMEAKIIFNVLWEHARQLSPGTLREFDYAWTMNRRMGADPDTAIAKAVGSVEPPAISNNLRTIAGKDVQLEQLRRQVEEQYKPAFSEVGNILSSNGLYRQDVSGIAPAFRVNRFLNWVRLTHAEGDAWQHVRPRDYTQRRDEIIRLGQAWRDADDGKVYEGYAEGIDGVLAPFAEDAVLAQASKEQITQGLLGIHAFAEQMRFTSGGKQALPARFWEENNGDAERVRSTLRYYLHGRGDFIDRLNDVISDEKRKVSLLGKFCALELYGTVKPGECPPVNGRSAKALRFLGFEVVAA